MSGAAIGWTKEQTAPCKGTKALLIALADYADEYGFAWPAIATMAGETQYSERQVQRLFPKLVEAGLLVAFDVADRATGRCKARAYWFPMVGRFAEDLGAGLQPTAKALAAYAEKVGGRVTPMSPWEGDTHVTGEGDTHVTGRVTIMSPPNDPPIDPLRANALSERAGCAGFEDGFAAYETRGRGRTRLPQARAAWRRAAAEVGAADLVARVRRYVAEDGDISAGDFGAPGFEKWLTDERWRSWGGPARASADVAAVLPCDVPAEVVAILAEAAREPIAACLGGAGWRPGDRTILTRSGWAATALRDRVGRTVLEAHGVRVEHHPQATGGRP